MEALGAVLVAAFGPVALSGVSHFVLEYGQQRGCVGTRRSAVEGMVNALLMIGVFLLLVWSMRAYQHGRGEGRAGIRRRLTRR